MELVIGLIGWIIGLFLWSNIIGNLFATTPILLNLKRSGYIKHIKWLPVIGGILFATSVLIATGIWLRPFFIGSLAAGVIILFKIPGLRSEALENIQRDYPELSQHKHKS